MFISQLKLTRRGRTYTYHRLIESVRTQDGPRQRLIMSLGTLELPKSEWPRLVERIEDFLRHQETIPFGSTAVDELALGYAERIRHKQERERAKSAARGQAKEVYLEHSESEQIRELGPEYVAHRFWQELELDRILKTQQFSEKQCRLTEVQVVGRLVAPRSELATVSWFGRTALDELMAASVGTLNEDRLYRLSDKLYQQRVPIEAQLAAREKEIFSLEDTIILYDLTSTYFEGTAAANEKAAYGYSRDHRSDQKQVVIGLVLDGEGFPKAHEVFKGNTKDRDTLEEMLDTLEGRVGGGATVVVDRGLANEQSLAVIREHGHHYIVTTRQSERRQLFPEIEESQFVPLKVDANGQTMVSAQLRRHEDELYVLCHSKLREPKDRAIRQRFERRFEQDAEKLTRRVAAGNLKSPEKINQAIGRLRERYPRVARFYDLEAYTHTNGTTAVRWTKKSQAETDSTELDGTYLMRTDRTDLQQADIWKLYVMLWRVERSFRYLKSDLGLRPVFHQRTHRVEAHIFISLLAYHLLHAIERRLQDHGDHRSWPTIRDILATHQMVSIVHQCTDGSVFRLRRPSQPELAHRAIYKTLGLPATPPT